MQKNLILEDKIWLCGDIHGDLKAVRDMMNLCSFDDRYNNILIVLLILLSVIFTPIVFCEGEVFQGEDGKYYQIIDGGEPQMLVSRAVRDGVKLDAASLSALAEKSKTDVLVVARIYEMDESLVSGWGFRFDHDTYVRVVADADLFVYKKDGNKLLKKRVRESGLRDMGNYDKPAETIKWQLSKLVNTMENKPIIGS